MKFKDIKSTNLNSYCRDSNGYLKKCEYCGQTIYMLKDYDGIYRPYESWIAGNATEGDWILHECIGTIKEFNNKPFSKKTEITKSMSTHQFRFCPKCHIQMPVASKVCDFCGYEEK